MRNPIMYSRKLLKRTYQGALRSIAFYPILISLILFFSAIITISLENLEIVASFKKKAPYLFIEDMETARTILSTLIGGILSLTVFSFTMVMVVLSQASTNFSPRLLPGLVSNKRHQLILGVYIGTLLYCTIVLISLGAYQLDKGSIGMSTTLAAILGVFCVGLFVYFIHTISGAIQVQNIVGRIYERTDKKLKECVAAEVTPLRELRKDEGFANVVSKKRGYFQSFDMDLLDSKLFGSDLQLVLVPYCGQHIWEGDVLLRTSRQLTGEEVESLQFACGVSRDLHDGDHPLLGLIKLMEVAVRAMSPGVNDPGTALDVVYKLGPLLKQMVRLPAYTSNHNPRGIVIAKTNISTQELLQTVVRPIRYYAKNDSSVMMALADVLMQIQKMGNLTESDDKAVASEIKALREAVESNIGNEKDKRQIIEILETG